MSITGAEGRVSNRARYIAPTALCLFEAQEHAAKFDFVVIMQSHGRFSRELLPIEKREICAVLVFKHILAVLNKDASVHARDATFFSTMRSQIHIRENVADSIFAADH